MAREKLSSQIGFILLAAGCAIGLGNIWRFPFIVGRYGGGAFVLIYLVCLLILGFPVLVMELAVGRGGRKDLVGSFADLARQHSGRWRRLAGVAFCGNLILMMYYTTVSGWLLYYFAGYCAGMMTPENTVSVAEHFNLLTASPLRSIIGLAATVAIGAAICGLGLRRGVESAVKFMMLALFAMLIILAVVALRSPAAPEALRFYLLPDWNKVAQTGVFQTIHAAMGQAFFTLSLGVGSMAIFGSYIDRKRKLASESIWVIGLDTMVALLAGLVIFPICMTGDIEVTSGPGLIFLSLPTAFRNMAYGQLLGAVFFFFLALAAMTTVVAVFENLVAYLMDERHFSRRAASWAVGIGVFLLSLPCALGFNLLEFIQPMGEGSTILDLEDFIVSQNLLPLGALLIVIFTVWNKGWGWKNFIHEANAGKGIDFPVWLKYYAAIVLPLLILGIFCSGYIEFFQR